MKRRTAAMAVVGACVIAAVVLLLVTRAGDDGNIARARAMVDEDHRFATAFKAGDTLAVIGELLQADGERCRRQDGATSARCGHLLAASAAAQVMAYRVLGCTGPGRFEARARMAEHLDALARGVDPGDPPVPPDCG